MRRKGEPDGSGSELPVMGTGQEELEVPGHQMNGDIGKRDVIEFLVKEYESLRAEVVQRVNARQQVAGYGAAISAIMAAWAENIGVWRWLFIAAVLLGAFLYVRDSNKAVQRIGIQLQQTEKKVNGLCKYPVLTWELLREEQRRREAKIWKFVGWMGGWYLRDQSRELPLPSTDTRRSAE